MKYGNARKKSKWTINSAVNDRIIDVFCSFLLTYVFMIFYTYKIHYKLKKKKSTRYSIVDIHFLDK